MAKAKKLPSGNWRVQASITVDGNTIKKSFTAETQRRAEALAVQWQQLEQTTHSTSGMTLRVAYDRYIDSKSNVLSPNTIRDYRCMAKNNLQDIMDLPISNLTENKIQQSINLFSVDHSPKSVRNVNGLLSAVLKTFRPEFRYNVRLPQKKPAEWYLPTDNDIKRLLAAIKDTPLEIPVLIATFGGCRRGEICALNSNDVIDGAIIINKALTETESDGYVLKTPKTVASNRIIELPDFVIEKLKNIEGPITKYNPDALTKAFSKSLLKNNIPRFRFHDLRHYNVSMLHAMGIPDKYIMSRGGWSTNITMNRVYNHTISEKQKEFDKIISENFTRNFTQD